MAQYLLALYRDYAVPVAPETSQQVWSAEIGYRSRSTGIGRAACMEFI